MRNHLTLAQKAQDAEEAADRSALAAKLPDDGQPASAVSEMSDKLQFVADITTS
jgi:hypothetical protein